MNELNNKIEKLLEGWQENIWGTTWKADAIDQLSALITEQVRLGRIDELEYFINNINYDHLEEKALRHRLAQLKETAKENKDEI